MDLAKIIEEATSKALGELDSVRQKIEAKRAEIEEITSAPLAVKEALAQFDELVDQQAEAFDPSYRLLDAFTAGGKPSGLFELTTQFWQTTTPYGTTDAGPLLCWLFGDEIKKRMRSTIKQCDYDGGLPVNERRRVLEKLHTELRTLEEQEERMVMAAEAANLTVSRRPEADPMVVLEVEEVPDEPREPRDIRQEAMSPTHGTPIQRDADGRVRDSRVHKGR